MEATPAAAEPRGKKRGVAARSPGADTQPLQSAPEQRFDVQSVVAPYHWRALPVHDPRRAWAVRDTDVAYYFDIRSLIGEGAYGRVYEVELNHGDAVPAFAGLDVTTQYALKVEEIEPRVDRDPAIHGTAMIELEIALALRQFGVDTAHYAPLYAWTRWYFDAPSQIAPNSGVYQLMLSRLIVGGPLKTLYGVKRNEYTIVSTPSQTLADYAPSATNQQRILYAGAAVSCQLLCALHLLRSCGLSQLSHMDLHADNVLCENPGFGDKLLIYSFDQQGTQGLVLPLALTRNTLLKIIDFGFTRTRYAHLSAGAAPPVEHIIKTRRDYSDASPDIVAVFDAAFNTIPRGESAQDQIALSKEQSIKEIVHIVEAAQQPPVSAVSSSSSAAAATESNYPELSDGYYGALLKTLGIFAPFRFVSKAELAERLATLSELLYGAGDNRLVLAHENEAYRVVHLPDYGANRPALPAMIAAAATRRQ